MKMNIDQKMEFIRKALEMGADVDVKFYEVFSKQEAEEIAAKFSEMLDVPYEELERDGTRWLRLDDYKKGVHITIFYTLNKEEKEGELLKQLTELKQDEEVQS